MAVATRRSNRILEQQRKDYNPFNVLQEISDEEEDPESTRPRDQRARDRDKLLPRGENGELIWPPTTTNNTSSKAATPSPNPHSTQPTRPEPPAGATQTTSRVTTTPRPTQTNDTPPNTPPTNNTAMINSATPASTTPNDTLRQTLPYQGPPTSSPAPEIPPTSDIPIRAWPVDMTYNQTTLANAPNGTFTLLNNAPPYPITPSAPTYNIPHTNTPHPQPANQIVNIVPAMDNIEPYKEGTSFEDYLERWEILMAQYNYSNAQLALALPAKLSGSSWETYKNIIKLHPGKAKDYQSLKKELFASFRIDTPLQERNLWTITQGKKSVNDYYAEIVAAGRAVFKDMPEVNRDQVITSAFIGGLKENYQRAILKQGETTLQQALKGARNLEAIDKAVARNKVMSVSAVTHEPVDPIAPLTKQVEGLARLVTEQNRRMRLNDDATAPRPTWQQPTVFHRPRGCNSNYNTSYSNYRPRPNQHNMQRNNFNRYNRRDFRPTYRPRTNPGDQRTTYQPTGSRPGYNNRQPSYRTQEEIRRNGPQTSNLPYCRACQRCHPLRQCSTVNNVDTTEPVYTTAEPTQEEMTPTEFANFYLTQPPETINNISTNSPEPDNTQSRNGHTNNGLSNGRKFGITEQLQLTLICLITCFVSVTGNYNWQPNNPMICGSEHQDYPNVFKIQQQYNCTT